MWRYTVTHGRGTEGENGEWSGLACTLHTTSEHDVSNITTADAHNSAASSRLNWRLGRFKWARPFRRKTKSVFCACAITFHLGSTNWFLAVNHNVILLGYNDTRLKRHKFIFHDVITELECIWFSFIYFFVLPIYISDIQVLYLRVCLIII